MSAIRQDPFSFIAVYFPFWLREFSVDLSNFLDLSATLYVFQTFCLRKTSEWRGKGVFVYILKGTVLLKVLETRYILLFFSFSLNLELFYVFLRFSFYFKLGLSLFPGALIFLPTFRGHSEGRKSSSLLFPLSPSFWPSFPPCLCSSVPSFLLSLIFPHSLASFFLILPPFLSAPSDSPSLLNPFTLRNSLGSILTK